MVTSSLRVGGSEKQFCQLAIGLRHRGWDVWVISLQAGGSYRLVLNRANIPVRDYPIERMASPSQIMGLRRAIAASRPHVVHTQAFRANLWARLAAISLGLQVVASVRATYSYLPRAYFPVERMLSQKTLRVVTPANACTDYLIAEVRIPKERVTTIPNGVDTAVYRPRRPDATFRERWALLRSFVILCPGRLVAQKNHEDLISACGLLAYRVPNAALVIAGRGPLEDHLRDVASRCPARVIFVGELPQADMPFAMAAADVVCLMSHFEGAPNALLEGMASGRPVVASRVDGSAEIIEDGVDGYLVEPGDTHAMASVLARIAESETLRSTLGAAGRLHAERAYSIQANVSRHEEIYNAR
jgi:glycosyltransferase involved in cell wall biosynthesis